MVRKGLLLTGCGLVLAWSSLASAETLQEALESAYETNPTLTAQRANVRVADEEVPIARSAGLPTLDANATYQENILTGEQAAGGFFSDPDRQLVAQLNANVPLLTFGAVSNSVRAAEERVATSRLGLRGTESDLFSAVVAAYMDVLRDEAVVQLNLRNKALMEFTATEARQRQNAGNRGPTDVAQAEARVSLAESQLATAEAQLIASREEYIRLVGHAPGDLEAPPMLPELPTSSGMAVAIALDNNPELMAAQSARRAAEFDVEATLGAGRPRLSAIGGLNQYDYLGSLEANTGPRNRDQGTTAFVGVRLDVPIFQGGRVAAQMRQAQARESVAIEQELEAERQLVSDVRSAYANLVAANAVIGSSERGVAANERVLSGLRAETRAGFRPLLDLLNAEQEMLNAEVTLVTARRDAYVAGFVLLAAMGRAEARDLNFENVTLYDPTVNFERVDHAVFQMRRDPEPAAVATGTVDVPEQDAQVEEPDMPAIPTAAEVGNRR